MSDNLRPYTVAAVVNTDTGELVGTPIVRLGREDYDRFSTVNPLAANEQFRWVHVWAPTEASAVATDTLTADLRPGGDRTRPVARALTGESGLKRYTVAGLVHTRTGRLVGVPVVTEGHQGSAGTPFAGRHGTRSLTANVWACDRADAAAQVVGIVLDDNEGVGLRAVPARDDPDARGQLVALDTAAVAYREWTRLAGLPADARAAAVADTVWNREYPPAYHNAYTAAANRMAAQAIAAAAANPDAWPTLQPLATAARQAIGWQELQVPTAPPTDHPTMRAVQMAAAQPGQQPPWQRVADLAATGSRTAGTLAGTLTATTDVLTGWRRRSGHAVAEGVTVDGRPARAWIGDLLATVNRDTAASIAASDVASPVAASASGRTVAQLAREDQAPGAATTTDRVEGSRARSAASPAPTVTRRTR